MERHGDDVVASHEETYQNIVMCLSMVVYTLSANYAYNRCITFKEKTA